MGTKNARRNEVNFTKKSLLSLKPPKAGRVYWYDSKQDNLALCITAAGSRSFYRTGRVDGKPERIKIGRFPDTSIEQARKTARTISGKVASGEAPRPKKPSQLRMQDVVDHWMTYSRKHKRSSKSDERMVGRYFAPLMRKAASDVTIQVVDQWHEELGRNHGPVMANRCKSLLAAMFKRANRIGFDKPNPCTYVRRFQETSRDRFLQRDEIGRFLAAVAEEKPIWRTVWTVAIFTGARIGNIMSMKWADLDLAAGVWTLPARDMKAGKSAVVVLPEPVVKALAAHKRGKSEFVFPSRTAKSGHRSKYEISFERIKARCGIDDIVPHDLRRTVGSWLAISGASSTIVGSALSHAPGSAATAIYSRLTVEPVRAAIDDVVRDMQATATPAATDAKQR